MRTKNLDMGESMGLDTQTPKVVWFEKLAAVSQANPILGNLLKATESSSTLVPNISAWPLPSALHSPFPTAAASTSSCGPGTPFWGQSLPDHTSVHPAVEPENCLPCLSEGRCTRSSAGVLQPPRGGGTRPRQVRITPPSAADGHQLLTTNCFTPQICSCWDSLLDEVAQLCEAHLPLFSNDTFHLFRYLQSPLDKKSTNLKACLWPSSNEAIQSSYKYYSWQFAVPLRWDQADLSSAELQLHSPGERLSLHGPEHQRTAPSPLPSGSGHPSWQPLASSRCTRGRSSQTCSHHSYSQQSFLNREEKCSHDIMNQGKLTAKRRKIKN